jgi:galactose mutarotase-like enzyme
VIRTQLAGWPAWTLVDGDSTATVVPARGGLVATWAVAGRPRLWLDEATLADPAKNVRGGVPILFPTPGKRPGDRWAFGGRTGVLPQHGFARALPWQVVHADGPLGLRLERDGDPSWPWPVTVELDVSVSGDVLRLEHRVTNRAEVAAPHAFGFHPYFLVADAEKGRARLQTSATRAWDNVAQREVELAGPVDLTGAEVDLHLLDHRSATCVLEAPGRRIEVAAAPEYGHWVTWTLGGKDFVCVEPWTGRGDALLTGVGLRVLGPGETERSWVELRAS